MDDQSFSDEFEAAAYSARERLNEATLKNYRSAYKRILGLTDGKQIHTMSQDRIIDAISSSNILPETKNQFVSVVLLVRRHYDRPIEKVINWRFSKLQPEIRAYKISKKSQIKGDLPSIAMLRNYYDELFRQGKNVGFIINFLLVNYGFRNKDLRLIITRDKAVIRAAAKNSEKNYIYLTKTYAWLVINDYKTKETYNQKKIKVRDSRFHRAAADHLGDRPSRHLLDIESADGEVRPIEESSLQAFVQSRTYENLGEGKIFKAVISEHLKKGEIKRAEELSKSRGTAFQTILDDYNVHTGAI